MCPPNSIPSSLRALNRMHHINTGEGYTWKHMDEYANYSYRPSPAALSPAPLSPAVLCRSMEQACHQGFLAQLVACYPSVRAAVPEIQQHSANLS